MTLSIVIVGETGAGKSALINLLADKPMALVSSDVANCTEAFAEYTFNVDSTEVRAYDTMGFSSARVGNLSHLVPYERACNLIQSLKTRVDIVFVCTNKDKLSLTTRHIYHLFNDFFFDGTVPIALIATHREKERSMEDWWERNLKDIKKFRLNFAGHACITTQPLRGSLNDPRYGQSKAMVIQLLGLSMPHNNEVILDDPLYPLFDRLAGSPEILTEKCSLSLRDASFLTGKANPLIRLPNVVLFGETGVGKSSVINLIAGYKKAPISSRVRGCTLDSKEYRLIGDASCLRIFDTVGLNCAQVEGSHYLNAIKKAYKLIEALNRAGGVDLLLFCIRGGRINAAQLANYKLFQEYLCEKKVPVAIVVTHLENEDVMDGWWEENKADIANLKIDCIGHACITAIGKNTAAYRTKLDESRQVVLRLLKTYVHEPGIPFVVDTDMWLSAFLKKMGYFIRGGKLPKKRAIREMLVQECGYPKEHANAIVEEICC
ncbi:P-loop containing nucleoside triphosphate hydrolase protein [Scleroderma yunnanense]